MTRVEIPYHRTRLQLDIPEQELLGVYHSRLPEAVADENGEIERALRHPIGSRRLCDLAARSSRAVVICSDHTRPVPSKAIIPPLLAELRRNNPQIDITLLIATGFHRATTRAELAAKFGDEIVAREKIVVHDSGAPEQMIEIGRLPSGGRLLINRLAAECDLLVAEGFIEPHFFAGFSGGRKSVLPGIASRETVLANHCAEFIADPGARTGNLEGNPIHRDMISAARQAKLAFIVNVVIDSSKRVVKAFAGGCEAAHAAGVEFLNRYAGVEVPAADIVITSNGGYPLDMNVYQSVKGMTAAEAVCRPGGVIIMAASCIDGHGGESFYRTLARAASPEEILKYTAEVPRHATQPDQWEFQILARILSRYHVIVVTSDCDHQMLREMMLDPAATLPEAYARAREIAGSGAKVAVIPDGVSVIARLSRT